VRKSIREKKSKFIWTGGYKLAMTLNKAIHYLLLIGISGVFLFTLAAAMGWVNQGDFALPLLLLAAGLTLLRETDAGYEKARH
jgi:hypothetical protein